MPQPIKDAVSICKTIMRNGMDAYVINAPLQEKISVDNPHEVDICTEMDMDGLVKLFPSTGEPRVEGAAATLTEGRTRFHFYPVDASESSYTDTALTRLTPRMLKELEQKDELSLDLACPYLPWTNDAYEGFRDPDRGEIAFVQLPDEALKRDYLRAIRAMRFSANYHLPIEANSWLAIVRNAKRVLDYVPVTDIMDEWRKVEAENMHAFAQLLFDSMILHGLIPELAALSRVTQIKNQDQGEETVWAHTMGVMRFYPEELPYDWYGAVACLFHDVGKLYTGEWHEDKMTFYQHHQVGAKVTRKILRALRFEPSEIDLICHLVRHHMRFHFMLTDKGIRRFKSLEEYPRLIEIVRADLKARDGNYTEFNHNLKMLERADIDEDMLEPLLNGHEIMEFTGVKPGPEVGLLRDALLQAQIAGKVTSVPEAVDFVVNYKKKETLQ
ncbi:MAG: HD domain-containing protein [Desulfonatronovibrionaceae bacterium]